MNVNDYIEISLCISGRKISPAIISDILDISPTSVKTIDEFRDSIPDEIKTNIWCYTVKKYACNALCYVFDELIEVFKSKTDNISNIVTTYQATTSVVIVTNIINDELPELLISPDEVSFLNEIGAELSFDIYNC